MKPDSEIGLPPCLVTVFELPKWVPWERFLGPYDWRPENQLGCVASRMPFADAADVSARLRGVILDGRRIRVICEPEVKRPLMRKALLQEARRMREKTKAFRRKGVRIDSGTRLFVTPEDLAMKLAKRAENKSVVDGFCGLGGNAIAFARCGCRVNAIEIDRRTLGMAAHNAAVYGVSIQFRIGNIVEIISEMSGDLLWLDPPWGELTRRPCVFDELPGLEAILKKLKPGAFKQIWIKLPPTIDTATLPDCCFEPVFGEGQGDRHRIKFIWARIK